MKKTTTRISTPANTGNQIEVSKIVDQGKALFLLKECYKEAKKGIQGSALISYKEKKGVSSLKVEASGITLSFNFTI